MDKKLVVFKKEYFVNDQEIYKEIPKGTKGVLEHIEFVTAYSERYVKIFYIYVKSLNLRFTMTSDHEDKIDILPYTKAAKVLYDPKNDPELDDLISEDADDVFGFKK